MKLTLKSSEVEASQQRLASASTAVKAEQETLAEAWARILNMKITDRERSIIETARKAIESGEAGRLNTGKLSKSEVLNIGKGFLASENERLREQRIKDVLDTKPSNYFVLTDDNELDPFVKRVEEEIRLQHEQWSDKYEVLGVHSMTANDFEGTGIDSYIDLTIGFSIWLPILNEGYYLAYGHVSGFDVPYAFQSNDKQLTRSKVLTAIIPYLTNPNEGKAFHMGAPRYDMHVAENDGYSLRGVVWDTLDAMNLMNEHEEGYGLKPLTQKYGRYFGIEKTVYTFDDLFGNRSPAPFNTEIVGIYAINDVKYGWGLFNWQFETMAKTGRLLDCYAQIDSKLPETDVLLERAGFELDVEALRELEREFTPKIKEAERDVFEAYEIDTKFVREMDRKVKANKITKWCEVQQRRIDKKQTQIETKRKVVKQLEIEKKTHTKRYQNELDAIKKYEVELNELLPASIENAPQEITEFSITNGTHIGYLIYDVLGIKDKTKLVDKAKTRSTAADVLAYYYENEPALKPLAVVAEYTKLLTTYIRPMLGIDAQYATTEADKRLHSNFKAGGTSTGRYSSSSYSGRPTDILRGISEINDANYLSVVRKLIADDRKVKKGTNLQNIPSKGEGKRVRKAFKPKEGYTFIGSDLGQIEPRIQAHIMYERYSDNSMRQLFIDGVDLYTSMAAKTFGLDESYCVDKALDPTGTFYPRKLIKEGILAKSYGQTPQAFATKMKVTMEVAETFFDNFDKQFPSFTQMVTDIRNGMKESGYVETLYGRKRRFPDYKRVSAEVRKNERKLMGYYIERKQLRGKKEKSQQITERLKELERLISPLAEARNLVSYWERASFNAVIQGTGADILKMNGNRLARICIERGWEYNASIHDEVKISVPNRDLTMGTIELMRDVMANTAVLSVPLITDTVIETCWMDEHNPEDWFKSVGTKGERLNEETC